jgi:uncharacterized protein (DUF1015 family)
MANVRPFRATRYAREQIDALLSPPYDAADAELIARLRASEPHNSAALDASGSPEEAAALWRTWRESGVLIDEAEPAIYLYEGVGAGTPAIRGIFAAIPVGAYGPETGVYGHERTLNGPRAGRRALLAATRANLSPILLLRSGDAQTFAGAFAQVSTSAPIIAGAAPDDSHVRIWRVDPQGEHGAALRSWAAGAPLVIADGHHRYESARELAAAGSGSTHTLGLIVEADTAGPTLHATHRILTGHDGAAFIAALTQSADIEHVEAVGALPNQLHRSQFAVAINGESTVVTLRSELAHQPITARVEKLLEETLHITPADVAAGALRYERQTDRAISASQQPNIIALLLPPESMDSVIATALASQVMPQKATHFTPKPATGLLFLAHDQNAELARE